MKKIKLLLTTVIILLTTLTACTNEPATKELTIGLMASIDAFPIVIAYHHGYFEEEGLTVNLIPFPSAAARDAALQAGELDATTSDLIAVGLFIEANLPIRATGTTGGRFTLVTNEDFNNITELADQAVVISQNTAIDFVLDQMILRAGFELDHIKREIVPSIPERMELLRQGQVSAAVLPEPWATIAITDGLNSITNTVEMDFVPFIKAFTDDILENRPADVRAFYRAYNRAVDFLNESPLEDYFYIMVDIIGFSEEVVDHLVLPEFTHNQLPDEEILETAIKWLNGRGLVSGDMMTGDLISTVAFD